MKNQLTKFVLILICIHFALSSKNKQIFDFIRQANSLKGNSNNFENEKLSRPITIIDDSETNNRAITPIDSNDDINFLEKDNKLTKKFEDNDEFDENTEESIDKDNLKLKSSKVENDNEKDQMDSEEAFIEKPSSKSNSNLRPSSLDQEETSKEILSLLKDIKKRLIKDSFRRKSMELINKFQKVKKEKK